MPSSRRGASSPVLRLLTYAVAAATLLLMLALAQQIGAAARADGAARADAARRVDRIDRLEAYQSDLVDIETGQRGYLLTGQLRFLEPFEAAVAGIAAHERAIREVDYADPAAVSAMLALGREKLSLTQRIVALRRAGDIEGATRIVRSGYGKQVMDRLRDRSRAAQSAEERDLRAATVRADAARERRQSRQLLIQVALLAALGLLTAIASSAARRLRGAVRAAQDSATRQAAIFEGATDALMILDDVGRIESHNSAAQRLFAAPDGVLVGISNLALFDQPPSEAASRAYLDRLATHGEGRGDLQTFTGRRGDGELFEVDVVTTAIHLDDSLRFLVVARDATERRRVQRMKDEFVSTVSHELRTPMTAIAGALAMLDEGVAGALPDKAAKLVGIAHSSSRRMVRLVNDILDIEKLAAGQVEFHLEPLLLRPVLADAVAALEPFAAQHRVTVRVEGEGAEPVRADRDRLIQILTNLLSNAIKFSPEGGTVEAWLQPRFCGGQRLSIVDHGEGIDPAFRDRLFKRFAQADGSTRRKAGGTGLGLAISRQLADQMGIGIGVESRRGFTAFTLDFAAHPKGE